MKAGYRRPRLGLAMMGLGFLAAMPVYAGPIYALQKTIPIPADPGNKSGTFLAYDISFFDANTQNYYLADRSNASVDVFSAQTDSFVARILGFQGLQATTSTSGPNGVLVVNQPGLHQLWAGDGNSTLAGFSIGGSPAAPTYAPILGTPVATGTPANFRVDTMAYDSNSNHILVVNNAATAPFVTLIDVTTNAIVAKTIFDGVVNPNAAGGIEQPAYNAVTGTFFVALSQIGNSSTDPGGISEINASTGAVVRTISLASLGLTSCTPNGLTVGPAGKMLVGCASSQSVILDPTKSGAAQLVATILQTSGSDEVWYDPTSKNYFLADLLNPGGPVLGIIDALTNTFLENLPTAPGAHSVAVDPVSGQVFVPVGGVPGNTVCPNGCIEVFGATLASVPEPGSVALLAIGVLGIPNIRRALIRR